MRSNFDRALEWVLVHEGGYVDHPRDPGGATNLGITQATLSNWRGYEVTKQDVRDLSKAEAGKIYKARYWDRVRADELPSGIDYAVFDFAVNSGPSRAIRFLQGALGVAQDGQIGPVTMGAVKAADSAATINAICDRRLDWLKGLSHWGTFGKGWARRIRGVRKHALDIAFVPPDPNNIPHPKPSPKPQGKGLTALLTALLNFLKGIIR